MAAGRYAAAQDLLLRRWQESTAVAYAPMTARTHWISDASAQALHRVMAAGPLPQEALGVSPEVVAALLEAGLLQRLP